MALKQTFSNTMGACSPAGGGQVVTTKQINLTYEKETVPAFVVGLGIFLINLDSAREVLSAASANTPSQLHRMT
jgi:hypothetical protein